MKIYVRVLPYDSITPSVKFPPHFDVTFPFTRFFGDHTKQICIPDQKVAYHFAATAGSSKMFGVSTGHDLLQTPDELYVRLSWLDVGVRGKQCGLSWQLNNKMVWVARPLTLSAETRKELDALLAGAI